MMMMVIHCHAQKNDLLLLSTPSRGVACEEEGVEAVFYAIGEATFPYRRQSGRKGGNYVLRGSSICNEDFEK